MVCAIAELQLYYAVGADLRDGGTAACLEELSQARGEGRGRGGGGSREVGEVGTEATVDDELLLLAGYRELEEELLGGYVVEIGQPKAYEGLR